MADLITSQQFKDHYGITGSGEDTFIAQVITQASLQIENYCGRKFSAQSARTEYVSGGFKALILNKVPIIAITSITDRHTTEVISASDTLVDLRKGRITIVPTATINFSSQLESDTWSKGFERFKVIYTFGESSVPVDVELACILLVGHYRSNKNPSLMSRTIGDYSETMAKQDDLPQNVKNLLAEYYVPKMIRGK